MRKYIETARKQYPGTENIVSSRYLRATSAFLLAARTLVFLEVGQQSYRSVSAKRVAIFKVSITEEESVVVPYPGAR